MSHLLVSIALKRVSLSSVISIVVREVHDSLLGLVGGVRLDKATVHLRVDVLWRRKHSTQAPTTHLNGNLEAIEASGFRELHFRHEPFSLHMTLHTVNVNVNNIPSFR